MGVRVRGGEKVPNEASSIWGPLNGGFSPENSNGGWKACRPSMRQGPILLKPAVEKKVSWQFY